MNLPLLWTRRSIALYWRSHVAVILGVVAGSAALSGALLVGDSLRGSLREHALSKLDDAEWIVSARIPFQRDFAERLATRLREAGHAAHVRGGLYLTGAAMHAIGGERVNRVGLFGVEEADWNVCATAGVDPAAWKARGVIISDELARLLRAKRGDDLLLYMPRRQASSPETLLGRRDAATNNLRLTVVGVLPAKGIGEFDPRPSQQRAANAFVPADVLGRAAQLEGRSTLALISGIGESANAAEKTIDEAIGKAGTLADHGLRLRRADPFRYLSLESESMLLEPAVEAAAYTAAADIGAMPSGILSYLANEIRLVRDPQGSVPYSIVAGIASGSFVGQSVGGEAAATPWTAPDIYLNRWTVDDLQAKIGDEIELTYYVANRVGETETRSTQFTLAGVIELTGAAADPGFVPELKGVTDAPHMSDWDPPFPVDLKRIRNRDDDYWTAHRTTPKAYVALDQAQRLWAGSPSRFGQLTSIRVDLSDRPSAADAIRDFEQRLLARLWHRDMGMLATPVRAQAESASSGTTDFGGLFIGFRFVLIVSAAMLVGALFSLGIERRAGEIGMLLAVGFRPRRLFGLLLAEGSILALIGTLLGAACGLGYAQLMLAGLRTWWSDAVNAPFLRLHAAPMSLLIGGAGGFLLAIFSIWITTRRIARIPARALLAGVTAPMRSAGGSSGGAALPIAIVLFVGAIALCGGAAYERIPATIGFFGSGAALLGAAIGFSRHWLTRESLGGTIAAASSGVRRLAWRNAGRNVGRSSLVISLLSTAVFLIVALGAFHTEPVDSDARESGTGGFSLWAETTTPVLANLNTSEGRDRTNLHTLSVGGGTAQSSEPHIYGFRLREGDAVGCQNLYVRREPRILGATDDFLDRGGFRFASAIDPKFENPWEILKLPQPDGAISVIGDEAALKWQLHKGLGDTIEIADERGDPRKLRIVAMLSGSALQDELIVSESAFERLFPSRSGYSFFLVETPGANAERRQWLASQIENGLLEYGCDASPLQARLAGYLAVQNTYLRSFQVLGGLGLLLGTVGISAVLLRNIWERRRELALMQAIGFRAATVRRVVIFENFLLVIVGVLAGFLPALLAVVPIALSRSIRFPIGTTGMSLAAVLLVAYAAARFALRPSADRSPAQALRAA